MFLGLQRGYDDGADDAELLSNGPPSPESPQSRLARGRPSRPPRKGSLSRSGYDQMNGLENGKGIFEIKKIIN